MIEQDHCNIKRLGPMLEFKWFQSAAITLASIELMHRICKGQFALGRLDVQGQVAPDIRLFVLRHQRKRQDLPPTDARF